MTEMHAWSVAPGAGLVARRGDCAVILDVATTGGTEDVTDVLTALEAPDAMETIGYVVERLPTLRCALVHRHGDRSTVFATRGIVIVAGEAIEVTEAVLVQTLFGSFTVRLPEPATGPAVPFAGPVAVAGALAVGPAGAPPRWISGPVPAVVEAGGDGRAGAGGVAGASAAEPSAPVVATLVTDDTRRHGLRRDIVIGRHPVSHPAVTAGEAAGLVIDDESAAMSRVHCGIVVDGDRLTLVDLGSRHGTWVSHDGRDDWRRLAREERVPLSFGDVVRMGSRWIRIDAP